MASPCQGMAFYPTCLRVNRSQLFVAYATLSTLVTGCALPGADTSAPAVTAPVPSAWTQPAPTDAPTVDLRNWWKAFSDPVLDALVQEAITRNLDLAVSTSRLREARLESGRAATQFLPSLSANQQSLQDVSATDTYFHASIDMVWELGLFGAAQSTRQAAQAMAVSAGADAQGVRVSVIADVVRNYLDLRAAQQQLAHLQQIAALDDRAVTLAEVRVRTYQGTADELAQARLQVVQGRATRALLQLASANATQALAVLLGRTSPDPAWSQTLVNPIAPTLAPFALAQVPADLLRTRPDVHAAEAEVHRAAAALGLARSELYPRITLAGSYLYAYNLTQNRRTRGDIVPAIGPVIDIPIFDWGRRRTQVDVRQETLNAALISYRSAVHHGIAETEGALAALSAQKSRVDALTQATVLLSERAKATQTQARLGLASEYDTLARQRAQWQAQAELDMAQSARALAFVALYKALGGAPLPEPESQDAAYTTTVQ
jgi:NodT family efflux transporter outer membrane factor (OMF) lipoprotein